MTHIAGINIPRDKRVVVPLTYIYGISNTTAKKVLANVGVSEGVRVCDLINEQTDTVHAEIDKLKVEGDLRREVNLDVKRLMEIGSYHGIRHRRGLPTRGQNTKNNTRTREGPTKTVADKRE